MGDEKKGDLRVRFDSRLKLRFLGSKVTTDAGLLAYRELDEAPGLAEMGAEALSDSRQGSNRQHRLVPLLRQSACSDARFVRHDPRPHRAAGDAAASRGPSVCVGSPNSEKGLANGGSYACELPPTTFSSLSRGAFRHWKQPRFRSLAKESVQALDVGG